MIYTLIGDPKAPSANLLETMVDHIKRTRYPDEASILSDDLRASLMDSDPTIKLNMFDSHQYQFTTYAGVPFDNTYIIYEGNNREKCDSINFGNINGWYPEGYLIGVIDAEFRNDDCDKNYYFYSMLKLAAGMKEDNDHPYPCHSPFNNFFEALRLSIPTIFVFRQCIKKGFKDLPIIKHFLDKIDSTPGEFLTNTAGYRWGTITKYLEKDGIDYLYYIYDEFYDSLTTTLNKADLDELMDDLINRADKAYDQSKEYEDCIGNKVEPRTINGDAHVEAISISQDCTKELEDAMNNKTETSLDYFKKYVFIPNSRTLYFALNKEAKASAEAINFVSEYNSLITMERIMRGSDHILTTNLDLADIACRIYGYRVFIYFDEKKHALYSAGTNVRDVVSIANDRWKVPNK